MHWLFTGHLVLLKKVGMGAQVGGGRWIEKGLDTFLIEY